MSSPYNGAVGRLLRVLVALVSVGSLLTACGKGQAKTLAPVVSLSIPAPPARVPIPVTLPEPGAPASPAPPSADPSTRPPAEAATTRPGERPGAPVAGAPASPPAPVLQTTTATAAVELEQRTQTLLSEAERNLGRVNYRELGVHARAQYDSATSFIRNARHALVVKNYIYAEYLATKAAAVARELVKG